MLLIPTGLLPVGSGRAMVFIPRIKGFYLSKNGTQRPVHNEWTDRVGGRKGPVPVVAPLVKHSPQKESPSHSSADAIRNRLRLSALAGVHCESVGRAAQAGREVALEGLMM